MRICPLLLMLLLALALTVGPAHADQRTLSGVATLGVQQYKGESEGQTQKATSFYQQYAVTLTQQGKFYNGQGGVYNLMAGYEINLLDPTFERNGVRDPEVAAIDTSKLYYNGNLVIAPGGLPFRLSLFAFDKKQTKFLDDAHYTNFDTGVQSAAGSRSAGHLLTPSVYTDLSNGTSRTIGGTLLVGIRNGSYLGAYRDILSQLPRFLVDYKQTDVKDLHSRLGKTNYQSRDLAFVSLNKKDNWVHLRMRDHSDFINPDNDTQSKQVLIGTIDQGLSRKWINLTNWITLSGDLSYTVENEVNVSPLHTYTVNMMAISQRQELAATIFPRFNRENNGHFITVESELPMTVMTDINRDTRLRSRFSYDAKAKSLLAGQMVNSSDPWAVADAGVWDHSDFYLDNQFELQRSRPIIIKPRLEIEARNEGGTRDGLALRAGVEVMSNSRLSKAFTWLGGYALTTTRSNGETLNASGSYLQNEIYGRVDKDLSRTLRIGGRSTLTIGSGAGRQTLGFRIPVMTVGLAGSGNSTVDTSFAGTLTRGNLNLFLEHRYQRLGNRLEWNYEFFSADGVEAKRSTLQHALRYEETSHRLDWQSSVTIGERDAGSAKTVAFDFTGTSAAVRNTSTSWDSRLNYRYDPTRSIGLTLMGDISGAQTQAGEIAYKLSEELFYRIFTSNGIIRRLVELSEELGYEKASETVDGRNSTLYGRFSASYFPRKYLYGKLRSEIAAYPGSSALQQVNAAEVGADFEKLKIMASYSQGKKDRESATLPAVMERAWEVQVKKFF